MFQKIAQVITRSFPQPLDNGVLYDALAPVRPHCQPQDLSKPILNGWVVAAMSAMGEAERHPRAFTVVGDGELMYDNLLAGFLITEFSKREVLTSFEEVLAIIHDSLGSSDNAMQLAVRCNRLQNSRKGQ